MFPIVYRLSLRGAFLSPAGRADFHHGLLPHAQPNTNRPVAPIRLPAERLQASVNLPPPDVAQSVSALGAAVLGRQRQRVAA